jgi:hypothetical protein
MSDTRAPHDVGGFECGIAAIAAELSRKGFELRHELYF